MIYFSELKGKEVLTEDGVKAGLLEDLIFLASERAVITKLVIRDLSGNKILIPAEYLRKINSIITIRKDYQGTELNENELHLVKNLLDKQIIDLQDNKIVRVNDIALQDKDGFYIAGVDIGFLGVLRWFGIEKIFNKFFNRLAVFFKRKAPISPLLSWADIQPLELAHGQVKLKKEEKKLEKLHPEDLADYLEKTNIMSVKKILKMLDEKFAARVIGNLNVNFQSALFKQFSPEKAAQVLSLVDSDEAIDILLTLSSKKREKIIYSMSDPLQKEINHLLGLSITPIGGLISTEFITVQPDSSVQYVITKIVKETAEFFSLINIYVINNKKELIGVFNIHELLLHEPDTPVYKFMIQNIIVIHLTTPLEIVLRKMTKYKLIYLPVVNKNREIMGVVSLVDIANKTNLS